MANKQATRRKPRLSSRADCAASGASRLLLRLRLRRGELLDLVFCFVSVFSLRLLLHGWCRRQVIRHLGHFLGCADVDAAARWTLHGTARSKLRARRWQRWRGCARTCGCFLGRKARETLAATLGFRLHWHRRGRGCCGGGRGICTACWDWSWSGRRSRKPRCSWRRWDAHRRRRRWNRKRDARFAKHQATRTARAKRTSRSERAKGSGRRRHLQKRTAARQLRLITNINRQEMSAHVQ